MPRPKRGTAAAATNESAQVNSSDVALARSALFAAVEGCGGRDDDDDNSKMKDDSPLRVTTTKPFMALFDSKRLGGKMMMMMMIKDGITPTEQRKLLLTAITNFSVRHARRFFGALANIVQQVNETAAYLPDLSQQDDDHDDGDEYLDDYGEKEIVLDEKSLDDLRFLRLAAGCLQKYIERLSKKRNSSSTFSSKLELPIIDEAYDVAVYLHNILFELNSCGSQAQPTQAAIVDLCEAWWHANGRDREHLMVQCLPILALNAVQDTSSPQSTVKRLWEIRHALHAIDFDEADSSHSIRTIFLSIASSALCLKVPEGRRLLAYIFHVHASLMMDLHEAIRVQIPGASKMELAAYGEIYYVAWKDAHNDLAIRDAMETHVLSDLIDAALRLENAAMWTSIMTVLRPFYNNNKNADVEDLLLRLFGPVLWRSLEATDAKIRINAAHILAEVFPLQDSSHKNSKEAIDKSCTALSALLQDEDQHVRVAGSAAVAKILLVFWDAVPATDIRTLLNHVVIRHASDTKSAVVRAGALNSITLLLQNPHSHGVLRPLLPSLGNLIHDKVEKVRLTAARMLHSIGKAGIRYDNVVPVEHLTSRLEEEGNRNPTGSIASALTALLLNFYLPQGPEVKGTDVIERTIPFLEHYASAAKFFYANLVYHLPVDAIVKLVSMLLLCLNSAVEKEQEQDKKKSQQKQKPRGRKCRRLSSESDDDENSNNSDDSSLSASHISLMATLTEIIGILWQSIEFELYQPNNTEFKDFVLGKFSGSTLTNLLTHFEKKASTISENSDDCSATSSRRDDYHRTCGAILRCAGLMPPDMVEGLVPSVVSVLNSLSQGDCDRPQQGGVAPYMNLFCLWNMAEEVALSLASSIESFFENDRSSLFSCSTSGGPRRRKTRRSDNKQQTQKTVVPRLPARVALEVLRDILRGSDPSSIAARESILGSPTASSEIGAALERGLHHAERLFGPDSLHGQHSFTESEAEFTFLVCETLGKFALHQQVFAPNNGMDIGRHAERLLTWITSKLVPGFRPPLGDLDISRISMDRCSGISLSASGILLESGNKRSRDDDDVSCSNIARALRVSIMQAACLVFSEWLAVGASSSRDPIAAAATAWCKIFEVEEGRREIQAEALPAFSRLALQLGKTTHSLDVVKQILLHCKDDSDEDELGVSAFRNALSKLMSTRGAISTRAVGCVLDVAHELATRPKITVPYELPSSLSSLWPGKGVGCIRIGVDAILGSKCASLVLGKKLLDTLREPPVETDEEQQQGESDTLTLVDLRLLSCMLSVENAKARSEVTSMARGQIDVACFDPKSQLRPVVEKLLKMIG
jgi:condensin-2 complex subunit G2